MSGRGKGGKVLSTLFIFPIMQSSDSDLLHRALARVVLSVIAKSFATTSRVLQSLPFAASLVVVV